MLKSLFPSLVGMMLGLQGCFIGTAGGASAQQGAAASTLADRAAEEAAAERWSDAAYLWTEAAAQYRLMGDSRNAAESLRGAARAWESLGSEEAALALYGEAISVEDPEAVERLIALIERTPVTSPTLSLEREAAYIAAVSAMVEAGAGGDLSEPISSAEQAMDKVESLASFLVAPIQLVSEPGAVSVQYRRWKHRRSTTVPWNTVQTDTTVTGTPAWYQFRYPIPGAGRDTVVDVSCADGCLIRVPGQ